MSVDWTGVVPPRTGTQKHSGEYEDQYCKKDKQNGQYTWSILRLIMFLSMVHSVLNNYSKGGCFVCNRQWPTLRHLLVRFVQEARRNLSKQNTMLTAVHKDQQHTWFPLKVGWNGDCRWIHFIILIICSCLGGIEYGVTAGSPMFMFPFSSEPGSSRTSSIRRRLILSYAPDWYASYHTILIEPCF